MGYTSFGEQLRYFRRRARDPQRGGSLTQERLTHKLYDLCSLEYSFAAISDWERGKSHISKDHRMTLVGLVTVLGKYGGILSLAEANSWLAAGNYRFLDDEERIGLHSSGIDWHDFTNDVTDNVDLFLAPPLPFQAIIGRETIQKNLKKQLVDRETIAISAIKGLPGVGKTTVAMALAHDLEIQQAFPDGVLWVGLGRDPDVFFQLGLWARALGMTPEEIGQMAAIGMRGEAIRSHLSNRKVLLIIDDVWQTKNAQWFRLGGKGCAHIVTTRQSGVANEFADALHVVIDALDPEDSMRLLINLAPQVHQQKPSAVRQLAEASAGLPLALVLIGNHLRKIAATGQQRRVDRALADLQEQAFRFQVSMQQVGAQKHPSLSHEQSISLNSIIGLSEQALSDDTARNTLLSLGVFPPKPNSFSEAAALATMETSLNMLDTLVDSGLVEASGQGRYQIHQSITDYLNLRGIPSTASKRFARHYAVWLTQEKNDHAKVGMELDNILYASTEAKAYGQSDLFVSIVNDLYSFMEKRVHWDLANDLLSEAVEVATAIGDYPSAVALLRNLGRVAEQQRERKKATLFWQQACDLARKYQHVDILVDLLAELSLAATAEKNYSVAYKYLEEALDAAKTTNYPRGMCLALGYLGRLCNETGEYQQAQNYLDESIRIAQENKKLISLLGGLFNLRGVAARNVESSDAAEEYYLKGLFYARKNGRKDQVSLILTNLGEIETARSRDNRALTYLKEARQIVQEIQNKAREAHILKNLALLALRRGDRGVAVAYLEEAVSMAKAEKNEWLVSYIRVHWGELSLQLGDHHHAEDVFTELIGHVPNTDKNRYILAIAKFGLAKITLLKGEPQKAQRLATDSEEILRAIGHIRTQEITEWLRSLNKINKGSS